MLALILALSTPAPASVPGTAASATCPAESFVANRFSQIVSDWKDNREDAWSDARLKAFITAGRPYRVTGSSIAVKDKMRRVKLAIEWRE